MKSLRANTLPIAKTTFTLTACVLIACTAALRADDQTKSKTPGADSHDQAKSKAQSADSRGLSDKGSQAAQSTQGLSSSSDSDSQGGTSSKSGSQAGAASSMSNPDHKFIKEAAKGGQMEVKMGQLGVQKAQNAQVKAYAQRLVDDHTKANTELKQLAASKGITLPSDSIADASSSDRTQVRDTESSSTAKDAAHAGHGEHQAHMKRLEQLSGSEFDREFVKMAVKDHEKDVKEFEKQAQKATDAEVKAFAQKTAPVLREHLQQAKSLQTQIGQGAAGSEKSSTTGSESSSSSSTDSSSTSSGTSSGTK